MHVCCTLKTWASIYGMQYCMIIYWLNKRYHEMHTSLGWPSDLLAFCMVVYLPLVSSPSSQTEVSEQLLAVSHQTYMYTHRRIKGESRREGRRGRRGWGRRREGGGKGRGGEKWRERFSPYHASYWIAGHFPLPGPLASSHSENSC